MKLLILTQAVDLDDPILGFFHRWIEEFAKHCEQVSVICLKEGRHSLPPNVSVYSLGKPSYAPDSAKATTGKKASKGAGNRLLSRVKYLWNFYRYIWTLRHDYDSVFVHMNPEYVILGWKLWWLLRKKIALWYVHPRRSFLLSAAVFFSDAVCTVAVGSVNVQSKKIHAVGHGIDVSAFPTGTISSLRSVLFLGRLDPVKRTEIFVDALSHLQKHGISFSASIYGSPVTADAHYSDDLRNKMTPLTLSGALVLHDAIAHSETPAVYAAHSVYVNLTPTGSFDKTILEAMATECVVVAANSALFDMLPPELRSDGTVDGTTSAIQAAIALPEDKARQIGRRNRQYVEAAHSLPLLIFRLIQILQ